MLAHPIDAGQHAVVRIRRTADAPRDAALTGDVPDRPLTLKPRTGDPTPRTVRIVPGTRSDRVLLTPLLDAPASPAQTLADLDHQRGSIEELDRTIRPTLTMEAFHAPSLRGVQQELIARLTLIARARRMANDCERLINGPGHRQTRGGLRANPKKALSAVHDGVEAMLLGFATSCAAFVSSALARIADCMPADRIHHAWYRVSRKPIGKGKPPKPA